MEEGGGGGGMATSCQSRKPRGHIFNCTLQTETAVSKWGKAVNFQACPKLPTGSLHYLPNRGSSVQILELVGSISHSNYHTCYATDVDLNVYITIHPLL